MQAESKSRPPRRPAPGTRPRVGAVAPSSPPTPRAVQRRPQVEVAVGPEPAAHTLNSSMVALTCVPSTCDFDRMDSTSMFDTLGGIRALAVSDSGQSLVPSCLADARGYRSEDLMAIAEVGYQYLRSGGYKLADVIFQGLTAVQPAEPYYWLALGLVRDHLADGPGARAAYETAARLDQHDATSLLNLAELDIIEGRRAEARMRLEKASARAERSRQPELVRKARGLRTLMEVRAT